MLSLSSRIYEGRLAVVFLFLALLFSAEGVWAGSEKLVVQAGRLNVRQHPRMGAKVLWRLSRGDEAEVVKRFDEWVLLRYQKRQGYSRVSGGLVVLFQEKRSTMKKRKTSAPQS